MHSALYTGWVRHRRFTPGEHRFRYRIFMTYLDLAEVPQVFDRFWFWSARRRAIAAFRRADYHGDPSIPLDVAIRNLVERRMGNRPAGPIRLLTHLRFFGVCFNPVSFYYCFDATGSRVETIVAEITNTPWDERHAYVLSVDAANETMRTHSGHAKTWRFLFDKAFHVSPFLPMDMRYDWRFSAPGETLDVHMENFPSSGSGGRAFDATLHLSREPITSGSLARALLAFPFITVKVAALIYWNAARLWLKRTPFYTHPDKENAT